MKKVVQGILSGSVLLLAGSPAMANAPSGGYEGITALYYGMIAVVLGYGVYDIFFKKN